VEANVMTLPRRKFLHLATGCAALPAFSRITIAETQRAPTKYLISWNERSQGLLVEHENTQKRILEIFSQWKVPDNFKIEMFVVRVGDWGGYMLLDCNDPLAVHRFCSTFPPFEMQARPVVPVMDAVRGELEAIAWREGLKRN
jgi:hypothetical protein